MPTIKPNVLLIFTDQQRLSTMSAYGETPCRTPNLDALCRESVRFENAYTTCPLCSPARGTIMTGLYPHNHGITSNVGNTCCSVNELPDVPQLLSRRLQAEGYACGYTGKWHLGTSREKHFIFPNQPSYPRDVGFEGQNLPGHGGGGFRYPEYKDYLKKNGYTHEVSNAGRVGKCFTTHYGDLEGPEESTVPYFLAEHTIGLIDRFSAKEEPFFIWHNFWGPHEPYFATKKYLDMYRDVKIPEWPNFRWASGDNQGPHRAYINPSNDLEWSDWEIAIRHYYAFMTLIDEQIGRMVGHLKDKGLLENTMIIFTADHGETLGSHGGLFDKGFNHFEEIQRIPFLLRQPGGEGGGSVREEFASLADVYPTIVDAAGGDVGAYRTDGASLLPLVRGESCEWRDSVVVEVEGLENATVSMRTIRHGNIKYGYSFGFPEQLYDLDKDPHETVNLVNDAAYASTLNDMRGRLNAWMLETGDRFQKKGFEPYVMRHGFVPPEPS